MNDSEHAGLLTKLSNIQQSQVSYVDIILRFPFLKSYSKNRLLIQSDI